MCVPASFAADEERARKMNKLQLAMLTQWAQNADLPGLQGRKRMQKVAFFLQQVGCPIDAEFTLHHYGPYSRDVAYMTDIMVSEGLLEEEGGGGSQYEYRLGSQTSAMIESARTHQGEQIQQFESYKDRAVELLKENIWILELGSTILYFFRSQKGNSDWNAALQEACGYKRTDPMTETSKSALALAQKFACPAA